ncbi:MAG: type II secretion system protein GspG [Bdellovibrionales bacterium]|nr:type II secretion system protein GspG [Bdellovibrionales bacterium]
MNLKNNQQGIGLGEIMIFMAALCGLLTIYLPTFLNPPVDPTLLASAQADLKVLTQSVNRLEKETGILAGYPGANPCINDMEFGNLSDCRLGLACTDGRYPGWKGPYLGNIPKDPWGHNYYMDNDFYVGDGTIQRVIGSMGPNGVQDYGPQSDDIYVVLCSSQAGGA